MSDINLSSSSSKEDIAVCGKTAIQNGKIIDNLDVFLNQNKTNDGNKKPPLNNPTSQNFLDPRLLA